MSEPKTLSIDAVAAAILERLALENEVGCIPDGWEATIIVRRELRFISIQFWPVRDD